MRTLVCAATVAAALILAGHASAATEWLCGPGVADDPCRPSLSTTLYRGWDQRVGETTPKRARDRGVACFYVYPTVSDQQTRLANRRVDPEIRSIALYQAARFSQVCRVYAPVYRQATVPALQAGKTTKGDYLKAYGDVERAFDAFLRRIGKRGFVLIGHSQGAYHLQRLIRRRIDDHPALRHRMVSAEPFAPGTLIAAGISFLGLQWPTAPTTFVQSDGGFTGRCSRAGGAHVLRIASAPGTPVPRPSPTPEWGLHLVDANIAAGDLVRVLRRQIHSARVG